MTFASGRCEEPVTIMPLLVNVSLLSTVVGDEAQGLSICMGSACVHIGRDGGGAGAGGGSGADICSVAAAALCCTDLASGSEVEEKGSSICTGSKLVHSWRGVTNASLSFPPRSGDLTPPEKGGKVLESIEMPVIVLGTAGAVVRGVPCW